MILDYPVGPVSPQGSLEEGGRRLRVSSRRCDNESRCQGDVRKGPRVKEGRQPPVDEKGQDMDSLQSPQKKHRLPNA